MSRHFERKISLAITRRLALTRVTPDIMTVVSVGIGLLGAPFFLSASPVYQLVGALLFLTHSILDGCDGELARLKFMESPHGAILDFWGDNVVHVGVFACMAVGLSFAQDATWPLRSAPSRCSRRSAPPPASHATSCWTRRSAATPCGSRASPRRFPRPRLHLSGHRRVRLRQGPLVSDPRVDRHADLLRSASLGRGAAARLSRGGRVRRRPAPRACPVRPGGRHRRRALRSRLCCVRPSARAVLRARACAQPLADSARGRSRRRRPGALPGRPALRSRRRRGRMAHRRGRSARATSARASSASWPASGSSLGCAALVEASGATSLVDRARRADGAPRRGQRVDEPRRRPRSGPAPCSWSSTRCISSRPACGSAACSISTIAALSRAEAGWSGSVAQALLDDGASSRS